MQTAPCCWSVSCEEICCMMLRWARKKTKSHHMISARVIKFLNLVVLESKAIFKG